MTSLNRVVLTGKVVTPPRRHYRPDGSPVIQFPLELNDSEDFTGQALNRNGKGHGMRSRVEIVAVGKLAESKLDLLQSGQPVMVVGKLNQRRWQTPEGRTRTCTEVIATALRTIEETGQTRKSNFRSTDLKVDGRNELTPGHGEPGPQRRGFRPLEGSIKQGE